jgi:hypothetical protein
MVRDPDDVPRERIAHEPGTGDRFTLLVYTKATHDLLRKYGGDPVSPLYGPQARRLRTQERKAGLATQLIRHTPDGRRVIDSDF